MQPIKPSEIACCIPRPCDPSQLDAAAELAQREEDRRRRDLWRCCGIPARHREIVDRGLSLEAWSEAQRPAVTRAIEVVKAGGLVCLLGGFGTGKTQLAAWLCYGCCRTFGRPAMYRRFADLLAEVRKEAYADGGSDAAVVQRLSKLGLLVLDEIQSRRWTTDEQLWLTRILDHRYGEKVPTVLVANMTPDALRTVLDGSVIDRMYEGGAVVELVGESRRGATT